MKRPSPSTAFGALWPNFGSLLVALVLSTGLDVPAHATIVFDGFANALDGGGGNVGADWSSDWGPDYRAFPSGNGNYGGTTTPTTWPDGSFHSNESLTIEVQKLPSPGDATYLRATAVYDIGPSGPVSPDVVHRYRIENIVYNPLCCFGLSVGGTLDGSFAFSGVSAASPLYWAATWQIEFVNPGSTTNNINSNEIAILGRNSDLLRLSAGPLPPSQTMFGAATGSTTSSRIVFMAVSGLGGTGILAESRITLSLQIKFAELSFPLPGDYNQNGTVDAADYIVWRKSEGQTGAGLAADGDGNGVINDDDYGVWRAHFGQTPGSGANVGLPGNAAVPEPASFLLAVIALAAARVICSGREASRARPQHPFVLSRYLFLIATAIFVVCLAPPAHAVLKLWNTTSTDYWHVGPWVPAGPPTASDSALFDLTATWATKFNAVTGDPTINDLLIGSGNVTFQSEGGTRTLHVTGTGGSRSASVSPGTLTLGVFGGPMVLDIGGNVNVNGGGTLNVLADSDVTAAGNLNVGTTGSGTVTVSGTGSTMTQSPTFGTLTVGAATGGAGTLNVQSGGTFTTNGSTIVNPTGTIAVTGSFFSFSDFHANGNVSLSGGLNLLSGGTFSANGTTFVTPTGTIAISGDILSSSIFNANGDVVLNGGQLTENDHGGINLASGKTLTVQNGGDAIFQGGYYLNAPATVNVAGAGSTFSASDTFSASGAHIFGSGAQVNVTNGGALSATGSISIGNSSSTTSLVVDGAGSVVSSSVFYVGTFGGMGTATFRNGSTGNLGSTIVASTSTSSADGTLNVESGAVLSTTDLNIGAQGSAATGTVTVTGPGSILAQGGSSALTIGSGSTSVGTLTVADGGAFTSGTGNVTLNATGSLNINGGSVALNGPIVRNGGTINFNSGSLSFIGHLTVGAGGLLGSDLTLNSNRTLALVGITTIDPFHTLTLDGGTLYTDALVVNGTFDFQRGVLGITSAFGFVIGAGGSLGSNITLHEGQTLNVTYQTAIDVGALLVVESGAKFTSGSIANSGDLVLDGLAATATAPTVSNAGLIRGEGRIVGSLINTTAGEIRAEAGKRIKLQGANSANAGIINLQGGTAEFTQALTNGPTGQITGRGTLSVGGAGLTNQGHVALSSGITDVFGDVVNNTGDAARGITVSGNADVTFWDDVNNDAGSLFRVSAGSSATFFGTYSGAGASGTGSVYLEADVTPGASPATASFGGDASLGDQANLVIELGGPTPGSQFDQLQAAGLLSLGGELDVLLINGFTPSAGQSFDILGWGSLSGTFETLNLPALSADLMWNAARLYTSGVLSVGLAGDYNLNGIVDTADYVVWRNSVGHTGAGLAADGDASGTIDAGDYSVWRSHFGQTAGSGSGATGSAGTAAQRWSAPTIPEPASLVFLLLAAVGLLFISRSRTAAKNRC